MKEKRERKTWVGFYTRKTKTKAEKVKAKNRKEKNNHYKDFKEFE